MEDKKSDDNIEINNNQNINLQELKLKKLINPRINIKKISNLSDSIINYFCIGVCLFLHSAHDLKWFDLSEGNDSKYIFIYFIFAAVILYIIGIMNWYEGKELLFLFDFVFSFYFLAFFFKENNKIISLDKMNKDIIYKKEEYNKEDNIKLIAMFYIIICAFFLVLGISSFKKGLVYIINYFILFVGFGFLFFDYYYEHEHNWLKKTRCYIFIVSGAIMWIIGILKFINNAFLSKEETVLLGKTD